MNVGTRTSGECGQPSLGALPEPTRAALRYTNASVTLANYIFYWGAVRCQTGIYRVGRP